MFNKEKILKKIVPELIWVVIIVITCKITAIENDTLITINAGKQDGVFEGLQLYKRAEFKKE